MNRRIDRTARPTRHTAADRARTSQARTPPQGWINRLLRWLGL